MAIRYEMSMVSSGDKNRNRQNRLKDSLRAAFVTSSFWSFFGLGSVLAVTGALWRGFLARYSVSSSESLTLPKRLFSISWALVPFLLISASSSLTNEMDIKKDTFC